ncbi:hypothetical protein QMK50_25555 [Pseudomonas sp. P5_152]|uniref:hypothetical protein n=1 Tax=Pseudomonas sp. P5_152 TaxID=3043442 RepID=UPI002A3712DC|nr:hypothetical protein [Pseudomonas sp. P5_152]MDX9668317.1 hypothetical protein [Pseudomonas sp. P5_152]
MTSKKIKIADLIIETGLTYSGIPGADKIYTFAKIGASFVRDYISEQSEKKAYKFHRRLLLSDDKSQSETPADADLDAADYHALFSACLADIEEEKSELYGNLAKSIATNKTPKEYKRLFILKLKEITWDQLDLLANIHVIESHRIMPTLGNWDMTTKELLKNHDPFSARGMDIHFLYQNKFIAEEKITRIGKQFIESCIPSEMLQPSAYDYKQWLGATFAMLTLQENGSAFHGCHSIADHFRKMRVKGSTGLMEGFLERDNEIPFIDFLIIGFQNGKELPPSRLNNLEKLISRKVALQVIFMSDERDAVVPLTPNAPYIAISQKNIDHAGQIAYDEIGRLLMERKANRGH